VGKGDEGYAPRTPRERPTGRRMTALSSLNGSRARSGRLRDSSGTFSCFSSAEPETEGGENQSRHRLADSAAGANKNKRGGKKRGKKLSRLEQEAEKLTVDTMQGLQKVCPQGVVTGSQRSCRQMEHSSIDMLIRAEFAPSSTSLPSRAASMAVPSPSGLLSAKTFPLDPAATDVPSRLREGSGLAAPLAVRVKKGRLVPPGSSSVPDAQDFCPIRRHFLTKKPLVLGLRRRCTPDLSDLPLRSGGARISPFQVLPSGKQKGTRKTPDLTLRSDDPGGTTEALF
jgi:hypothetical protein